MTLRFPLASIFLLGIAGISLIFWYREIRVSDVQNTFSGRVALADDEDDAADDPPVNPPEAYYETTEGTEKSAPNGRREAGSDRSWRHPLHCRR